MKARIYRPAKTAMQSGRAKTHRWLLEFEPELKPAIEPLMGWTASGDTPLQVKLFFDTVEEALAYCRKHGIAAEVFAPQEPALKPKSYASNFRWERP